ncbi:hypothetical protein Sjap_026081 [Stephania japonica]|uniref:Uncharacterized protein n=1 Tax=Stephania japonica TaxID=461633 RepID=A0AAP0E5F4_9MAGN
MRLGKWEEKGPQKSGSAADEGGDSPIVTADGLRDAPKQNKGMPQSKIREERGGRSHPSMDQVYLRQSTGTH